MGGVAMLLGFITAMFFASRLNFLQGEFRQNHQAWVVMAGAAMICLLGVADDVWDLDWMLKLAGQPAHLGIRGMGRSADLSGCLSRACSPRPR